MGGVTAFSVGDFAAAENVPAKQVWQKGYGVQTGCLHWSAREQVLYVGYDDGSIQRLKVLKNGAPTEVIAPIGNDM